MNRCVMVLMLLCSTGWFASEVQGQGISLGARVGTQGPGVEVAKAITPTVNARVAANYLPFKTEGIFEPDDAELNVNYEADARLLFVGALVDYFPMGRLFRLTGGLTYNGTEVDGFGGTSEAYTVDNRTFTPEDIGTLTVSYDYKSKIAPYLGLGIGNPVGVGKRLGFLVDLGLLWTRAPHVQLEGTGMIGPTAEQQPIVQDAFDGIQLYPVLSLGFSYQL